MSHDDVDALVEVTAEGVGVDGVRVPGLLLDEVQVSGPDEAGLWTTTVRILSSSRPEVDAGAELVRHEPAHDIMSGNDVRWDDMPATIQLGDAVDPAVLKAAGWEFEHVPAVDTYRSRRDPGPAL